MIGRRGLLALLGALPFAGRALAATKPEPKPKPVGVVVKDPYSERVAIINRGTLVFDREGVENGYARPGDFYLDAPSGRYFVGVAKTDARPGDLAWLEVGRQA